LDDDPHSLDLSIAAGERTLGVCGPDDFSWYLLNGFQAMACQARWRLIEDPADLDRAIAHWQIFIEADADPYAAAQCGELMRQRRSGSTMPEVCPKRYGCLSGRSKRCRRTIRMAGYSGSNSEKLITRIGGSHRSRTVLESRRVAWIVRLNANALSDDAKLLVHNQRIIVACAALTAEHALPHTEPPRSAASCGAV